MIQKYARKDDEQTHHRVRTPALKQALDEETRAVLLYYNPHYPDKRREHWQALVQARIAVLELSRPLIRYEPDRLRTQRTIHYWRQRESQPDLALNRLYPGVW